MAGTAGRFFVSLFEQCRDDKCTNTAAALTYTSLLAIVPLIAISLRIVQALPIFPEMVEVAENLMIQTFSPESFSSINNYLLSFADRASRLADISIIFFLVTAVLTIDTINTALNDIWHVGSHRSWFLTLVNYLAILFIAPLLLIISLGLTTYLITLPHVSETLDQAGLTIPMMKLSPVLFSSFMFFLIYKLVPNAHVPWQHALAGALVAALLFEAIKRLFAFYLVWFPNYEIIYGGLAVIPLGLLWIYASWLVVLIGAEITWLLSERHGLADYPGSKLVLALQIIDDMSRNMKKLSIRHMHKYGHWRSGALYNVLHLLHRHGIVRRNLLGKWELVADPQALSLYDLYRISGSALPPEDGKWVENVAINARLASSLDNINKELDRLREVKIAGFIEA